MANGKLTGKQEMFCREYIVDFNATQAAIKAGYSEDTARSIASENLTKPDIQQRIQELMAERLASVDISVEYVLKTIKETVERCLQKEPVMEWDPDAKEMVRTGEWKFDSRGVLKGAELLGRYLKLFTDKIEHTGTVTLESLVAGSNDKKE